MKLTDLAFVLVISFSSEIPVRIKPHFDNVLTLDIRLICKGQNNKQNKMRTDIHRYRKQTGYCQRGEVWRGAK